MRHYTNPLSSILGARARRDLMLLTKVANEGLAPGERVSPIEYLKDFVDAGLLDRVQDVRRSFGGGKSGSAIARARPRVREATTESNPARSA